MPLDSTTGRFALPATTIDVRRVAWQDTTDLWTLLHREDEVALSAFLRSWTTPATAPMVYSVSVTPPLSLQLAPIPSGAGVVDLLTVEGGDALDLAANTLLGISDDYVWVITWGALADLLSQEGPAQDLSRAAYCQQRWVDGCTIARETAAVLQVAIGDTPSIPDALSDLDQTQPGWMNDTGTPTFLVVAGWNLVGLAPVPDAATPITLDVLRTAPVPANDAAPLNLPDDLLDMLLGYAAHLAAFKQGAAQVLATQEGYTALVKTAMRHNERLRARGFFADVLARQTRRENQQRPRRAPQPEADLGANATGGSV